MATRRAAVVIVTGRSLALDPNATLARAAFAFWSARGHRIIVHDGAGPPPAGDVAILHVDLTRVPAAYCDLVARYPVAINARVADISKRRVCPDLVSAGDAYDGPVMVKTDLNHAGIPERQTRIAAGGMRARLAEAALRHLPASWTGRLPNDEYVVFARKGQVPRWVWRTPALVVQPLYTERRGGLFAMHQWYCLGDSDCVSTFLSHQPVVKLSTAVARLPLHRDVPDALRRRRAELGVDYGKLDFIVHEGRPILLDANRTPNEGAVATSGRIAEICAAVAAGLDFYLRRL